MPFIFDKTGSGGDPVKEIPDPYSFALSDSGKMELYKDGQLIQSQDETGSWIRTSVSTGTGSIHLGDLHANGSGGENVVWLNTDSNIAWYPSWGGVSSDGSSTEDVTAREHGELKSEQPFGEAAISGSIDYTSTTTVSNDAAYFYLECVAAEDFTGRLTWSAVKSTGKDVAKFYFDVDVVAGDPLTVAFNYPLWIRAGQVFDVEITKDDGSLFKVRPSVDSPVEPYRELFYREFYDFTVLHSGKIGWADYADSSASDVFVDAGEWYEPENDGLGSATNTQYLPFGVDRLMSTPDGGIDLTGLSIGDEIEVRHTLEVKPFSNGKYVTMRHALGAIDSETYLYIGFPQKMEQGGWTSTGNVVVTGRFYIGSETTRTNKVRFQVKVDGNSKISYKGCYISVIKRNA